MCRTHERSYLVAIGQQKRTDSVQKKRRHVNNAKQQLLSEKSFHLHRAAVISVLMLSCIGAGAQSPPRDFSADVVHTTGKKVTNEKVYSSEKAIRIEKEEKGRHSISIMRLDRKAIYVLMPEQKSYMDMGSLGQGSAEMVSSIEGVKVERQALGSEDVGPYHCDKYRVQTTYEGRVYTSLEWDAKELNGFPVKQADEKGSWSKEYQNVKLGSQDPSLFEIPPDYKKIELGLGGMFKPQ